MGQIFKIEVLGSLDRARRDDSNGTLFATRREKLGYVCVQDIVRIQSEWVSMVIAVFIDTQSRAQVRAAQPEPAHPALLLVLLHDTQWRRGAPYGAYPSFTEGTEADSACKDGG
eukprot:COSAG02_NODE_676_length_18610_cov_44.695532_22_plen_114_part_00